MSTSIDEIRDAVERQLIEARCAVMKLQSLYNDYRVHALITGDEKLFEKID